MSYLDGKSGMSYLDGGGVEGTAAAKTPMSKFCCHAESQSSRAFSATPVCAMCYVLLSAHADRGLIGAWNSTL